MDNLPHHPHAPDAPSGIIFIERLEEEARRLDGFHSNIDQRKLREILHMEPVDDEPFYDEPKYALANLDKILNEKMSEPDMDSDPLLDLQYGIAAEILHDMAVHLTDADPALKNDENALKAAIDRQLIHPKFALKLPKKLKRRESSMRLPISLNNADIRRAFFDLLEGNDTRRANDQDQHAPAIYEDDDGHFHVPTNGIPVMNLADRDAKEVVEILRGLENERENDGHFPLGLNWEENE